MDSPYSRTQLLLGEEGMAKLRACRVAVFGLGGVGGYAVEALARSGIGSLDLIDNDKVSITNINRQIIATRATVGMDKTEAARQRVAQIDPDIKVTTHNVFFTPETADQFDFSAFDYVVDAIDTVSGKLSLVVKAKEAGVPIICAMGAGNKMDPTRFEVADISRTSVCPLARIMRKECHKRGIDHLKVVYSKEPALVPDVDDETKQQFMADSPGRRALPGSIAFVPSVVGLIIAGEVIKDLAGFIPPKE